MAAADPLLRTLGARLREERRRAGVSLCELAAASGLSPTTVHQIELGRGSPSLSTLQALAATLAPSSSRTSGALRRSCSRRASSRGRC